MPFSSTLKPIGTIRTPYVDKYDAPSQPISSAKDVEGVIELFPHQNFEQALADVSGFERIWIISWFDRVDGWSPKVLPPRSGRTKRGVFATRSPHRPNPIGLSLCRLLEVKGRKLRVASPDLLDGTPILDIKPYLPYVEAFTDAKAGWLDQLPTLEGVPYTLEISTLARQQFLWLEAQGVALKEWTSSILSHDPRPHSYRRTSCHAEGGFVFARKSWRVRYNIVLRSVLVNGVESGYNLSSLMSHILNDEEGRDKSLHLAFLKRWPSKA